MDSGVMGRVVAFLKCCDAQFLMEEEKRGHELSSDLKKASKVPICIMHTFCDWLIVFSYSFSCVCVSLHYIFV